MSKTDYCYQNNVYWLYDCASNFFEALSDTETIEQVDSTYHRVITTAAAIAVFAMAPTRKLSSTLGKAPHGNGHPA